MFPLPGLKRLELGQTVCDGKLEDPKFQMMFLRNSSLCRKIMSAVRACRAGKFFAIAGAICAPLLLTNSNCGVIAVTLHFTRSICMPSGRVWRFEGAGGFVFRFFNERRVAAHEPLDQRLALHMRGG